MEEVLLRVNSVRVFDAPTSQEYEVYSRIHLQSAFTFMGCRHNDAYQMTRMFFKTLTKAVKYTKERAERRFLGNRTTSSVASPSSSPSSLDDFPMLTDDDLQDSEVTATDCNFFSSSTEPTTTTAAPSMLPFGKTALSHRFLSLDEFGFKSHKVRNERQNKALIKELASQISSTLFRLLLTRMISTPAELLSPLGSLSISRCDFRSLVKICLVAFNYNRGTAIDDFSLACAFTERRDFAIILLAGSSGSGKSTLASSVAIRLGLGKLLSTDSVRHFLREFPEGELPMSDQDRRILFCSSYSVGDRFFNGDVVCGYLQHCRVLYPHLEAVLDGCAEAHESVVMEGVHLTPEFMIQMMMKYPRNVLGYVVHISDENQYLQRFSVRSKYMTLDPRQNTYVANFPNILATSSYVVEEAQRHGLCVIDNDNIDGSVALLHHSIFRTLRHVHESGNPIFDSVSKKARMVDPNRLTDDFRKKRMISVMKKKRKLLEDEEEEHRQNLKRQRRNQRKNLPLSTQNHPRTPQEEPAMAVSVAAGAGSSLIRKKKQRQRHHRRVRFATRKPYYSDSMLDADDEEKRHQAVAFSRQRRRGKRSNRPAKKKLLQDHAKKKPEPTTMSRSLLLRRRMLQKRTVFSDSVSQFSDSDSESDESDEEMERQKLRRRELSKANSRRKLVSRRTGSMSEDSESSSSSDNDSSTSSEDEEEEGAGSFLSDVDDDVMSESGDSSSLFAITEGDEGESTGE